MVHKVILLTLLLLQYLHGNYLSEINTEFHLKNERLEIHVSKKTGNITAIITEGKNLLSQEGKVDINIHSKGDGKIVKIECEDHYPRFARVYLKKEWPKLFSEYKFTIDSLALRWEVEVITKIGIEQETDLNFKIPIVKRMSHLFYPGQDGVFPINEISKQIRIYRKSFLIPIFCVYNAKEDYGLSIITPFEIPKPGLTFSIDKEFLIVTYNHLRLIENRKIKAAIYIVPHEGDWRPGLNFLLNKYPEYFYPAVEKTKIGEGLYYLYYLGGSFIDKNKIVQVKNRGVKWIELHGHFPFYGLYAPKLEDWGIIMDSDNVSLNDWEKGAGEKRNSYKYMQNRINLWHKYGIQVYLYFQSFEAWHQYAKKYFTEDVARNNRNEPHPAWKLCNLMNPDPTSRWGKYIINQARDLIKKYPLIDGIFYDRLDYWKYDFAHDDGITMINDKPAYMLGFALEKINEIIFDIFHKNKIGIWGNIPTSIEVCKNLDGIMAEIWPSALYKIQYFGLARPIIFLSKDGTPKETEIKLKNALLCGAFPAITFGSVDCQKLDEKYVPLFDLIKNRKWVLSKNPVEIPEGFKGNIFRTPEGDYVVVIMSLQKSQLVPHPFEYDIAITIRIPDADQINFAYLLSGDWSGVNRIIIKKQKNAIEVNLPFHCVSSLIYLTKNKKYDLVRLSSPILVKGKTAVFEFRVPEFDEKEPHSLEIHSPWFKEEIMVSSATIATQKQVPEYLDGEVELKIRYKGVDYVMSSWIVEPVSIVPTEDIFINETNGEKVPFMISNNIDNPIDLRFDEFLSKNTTTVKTPDKIYLQPHESRVIDFFIKSATDDNIFITAHADKKIIRKLLTVTTSLFFAEDDLFHDNFKHGMQNWIIDRGDWSTSGGVANGQGTSHFAFIKNQDWGDYVLEVKTRCKGSQDSAVDWLKSYLFFRLQDHRNFYRFGIHGDAGEIDLYKCVDGKWTKITSSFFTPEKDRWYVLRISVGGSKIIGYIEGKKILEANDNTFLVGGIGIGVLEDNMNCDYKDVVVQRL